jgi:RNA polymerase sigma factor (sigma-70 family)
LVQEAFLRLHELWDQIDNPRAWLYRSLRNMALNHIRDHRRETPLEEAHDPGTDTRPDEELGRLEAIGMVRLLLADLPPQDRDLILMKYHEELKYGEISKRTGLGVGNVGYKLHHLLKSLADSLRRAGIESSCG